MNVPLEPEDDDSSLKFQRVYRRMYSNTTFKTELSNKRKSRGRRRTKNGRKINVAFSTQHLGQSNTQPTSKFVSLRAAAGVEGAGSIAEKVREDRYGPRADSRSHSGK